MANHLCLCALGEAQQLSPTANVQTLFQLRVTDAEGAFSYTTLHAFKHWIRSFAFLTWLVQHWRAIALYKRHAMGIYSLKPFGLQQARLRHSLTSAPIQWSETVPGNIADGGGSMVNCRLAKTSGRTL